MPLRNKPSPRIFIILYKTYTSDFDVSHFLMGSQQVLGYANNGIVTNFSSRVLEPESVSGQVEHINSHDSVRFCIHIYTKNLRSNNWHFLGFFLDQTVYHS
jgi:hypothetical protein